MSTQCDHRGGVRQHSMRNVSDVIVRPPLSRGIVYLEVIATQRFSAEQTQRD